MKLKSTLSLFTFLLFSVVTLAQTKITGKVTDKQTGDPIPQVSIQEKGTSNGTVTDFDGNYSITVKSSSSILIFNYLGYKQQQVTVSSSSNINIALLEDASTLEEVVVIGYGSRKKSDITGAVASVKTEELTAFPVLDAAQALQGRAAGVVIQSNNGGQPGAPINIQIRGNTSIGATSSPLIVVDGFVGATLPQPNDIASMEILKDASATAIYGSRGSNGVVIVTTKKGKKGKVSLELNSNYSVQNISNKLDLLDANQFTSYQQAINPAYVQGSENTDWQDLLYRTGNIQNHQVSFSGGTDKLNFYSSIDYFKQDGVIINSAFERITFLSNIDANVNDKLKVGMNLFGRRGQENGVPTQSTGETANGGGDDVVSGSFRFSPDLGVLDANGLNTINSVGDDIDNPFAVATEGVNETKNDVFRANMYASYDILENLNFKSTFGFSARNENEGVFRPSTLITTAGGNVGGRAAIGNLKRTNLISENYLTYTNEIGKGKLTLLAGYSFQKETSEEFATGAQGFSSDSFLFRNLGAGAVQLIPQSFINESVIQSQFGRINYDFDDKYLFTATIRRDGASNFAANEKIAIFPSAAFGWKISNENFLKDNEHISNLKFRASYGETGNQGITPYQSLPTFADVYTVLNGATVNAVTPERISNPNLKWETSVQTNFGLDLGLFNDKVSLSLDYYNIDTKDLILGDRGQPVYFGFLNPTSLRNVGEINNSGFEINLNTLNLSRNEFRWTTDFNLSVNRNEVVKLSDEEGIDIFLDASPGYFNIDRTHILREGEVMGAFWGYEYLGVYQGGNLDPGTALLPGGEAGDQLFADLDGDGEITTDDQQIIGDPTPNFTFGITNNFTYKNFDLNIFIQGSQGGDLMNLTAVQLFNGDSNAVTEVLNSWTPSNTNTNIPRAKLRGKEISSRFVEDGSFVRLKNIALGYTLPRELSNKLGMENVRFSVSGQNLLTFTNYSGLDPEVSYFGSGGGNSASGNTTSGFDFGNYPNVRTVNFTLNLKF